MNNLPFSTSLFTPLKSVGSSIGLPFLSQNEDNQLAFRSGKNGVKRLASQEVIPVSDVAYWHQFYTLFESPADVFSLITIQDIRQALQNQPQNIKTLILVLSHHLFTLLPSDIFPSPPISSLPTLRSKVSKQDPTKEALNCIIVLGRILAVLYELDSEDMPSRAGTPLNENGPTFGVVVEEDLKNNFAWEVLWKRLPIPKEELVNESEPSDDGLGHSEQFALGDEDDEEAVDEEKKAWAKDLGAGGAGGIAGESKPTPPPRKNSISGHKRSTSIPVPTSSDPLSQHVAKLEISKIAEDRTLPSLADRLFSCTLDLLFCTGFTIPEGVKGPDGDKINYVIWEHGVGSTVNIGTTPELDRNKAEVLRFLLILLSSTVYTPPHLLPHTVNRPLRYLSHALERRLVLSLLCSWLNTSLSSASSSLSDVPYNHLLFKGADDRRTLNKTALMCLLVALDHWGGDEEEPAETPGLNTPGLNTPAFFSGSQFGTPNPDQSDPKKDGNAFRYFVAKLHRKDDFVFILDGILAILAEHTAITNGLLPGAKKPVPYIMEVFMLFWKLIDLNRRFRGYLIESGKTVDIVGYILLVCLDMKDNPAHHGLLRMLAYILQAMSGDKAFGVALNQPQRLQIPAKWAVQGTTADFLIVSMYSIATASNLNPLFQPLTITIANIAPYLKGVGVQASTRLLQLFKAFSAPTFLLADEGHPRLIYYLLETFNGILYHQLEDNPNLVYAILRAHQDFQTLGTFTLRTGLIEIQKKMNLRSAAEKDARDNKPDFQAAYSSHLIPEKAALLAREAEDKEELDLSRPSSPGSLKPSRHPTTAPISTPTESLEDPLASAEANAERQRSAPKSEKAKGKMRERSDSSSTIPASTDLEKLAAGGIGPNGYVPTQEWVASWQRGLPLDPVLLAISELLPKVQELQTQSTPGPSRAVLNYLRSSSLVEVLGESPVHVPRKFHWSLASSIWLTSLLWGDIYVAFLPNFNGTTVKLFGVKQAAPSRREQAIQSVSNRFMSFVGGSSNSQSNDSAGGTYATV